MGIQVVEKEEMKVVGISWNGTYPQMGTIPSLFTKLEERLEEIYHQTKEPVLIAPFHSRETEITYYVTTPVGKIEEIPEGMVGFTIPRKNYVSTIHRGGLREVKNTYLKMYSWMREYGYEQDHQALCLEIFKEEHKQLNVKGDLLFEIYVPLKTYKK
ncbi:GyrI-like domain-containing protein [Neobacillus soli]|uniref:GyrI-like domain-containing protein n=1 Tax=Neobacillus soli TaxID=220688 RepID=UPI000825694A|nr:GyrI-like domain-containing protein [Neobacillus soli]